MAGASWNTDAQVWTRGLVALCLLLLAAVLAPVGAARADETASVRSVAVVERGGATVIELSFDRPAAYQMFSLAQPTPRIVVDFPRLDWRLGSGGRGAGEGAGVVKGFRFASNSPETSRFVLDLTGPVALESQGFDNNTLRIALRPGDAARFARVRASGAGPVRLAAATPAVNRTTVASTGAAADARQARRPRDTVVVIDAGHGGRDPGAIGPGGTFEKTVTLASALILEDMLKRRGYRVVMTRRTDVYIPLEGRVSRARAAGANLFISLHADSGSSPDLAGASVYTLSEQGAERSRNLMDNQNWSVAAADRPRPGAVNDILVDLAQRETRNQSATFAQTLMPELAEVGPLLRNTHRKAGFFVLLAPDVPAVLLEMGFLTNAEDEARLSDAGFRRRQMEQVAQAIDAYFGAPEMLQAAR
jgi:N-acetylmuramoyl-L-alanine amidase